MGVSATFWGVPDNHCRQVWLSQGPLGVSGPQADPFVRSGQSGEGRGPARQRQLCSGLRGRVSFEETGRKLVSEPLGGWGLTLSVRMLGATSAS